MGIQINGNTNNINAGIGSLSIEDINELDIVGVATAANFKTGVSNLHSLGLTLSGGQLDVGSNIKIGTAGVVTATTFSGSGASLTNLPSAQLTGALPALDGSNLTGISAGTSLSGSTNNTVCTVTGANAIQGEANLTFDGSNLGINGDLVGSNNTTLYSTNGGSGVRAGLSLSGSDQSIKFYTVNGGSERLRILSSGELRIISSGNNNDPAHLRLHCADVSISTNDAIGVVRFAGRDSGGSNVSRTGALIQATAAANWDTGQSSGYSATHLDFFTQSNSGIDNIAAGARLRIDSSGRLLIGTTTEGHTSADDLTLATSGNTGMTIRSGTSNDGSIFFSDATSGGDEYRGYIQYNHPNDKLAFGTSGGTRLTIDGDGRLLVGNNSDSRTTTMILSGNSSTGVTGQGILNIDIGTTSVSDGTSIGVIRFGAIGDRRGADVRAEGAGTWSAGSSHPTDLIFGTNASGGNSTPSERMRIKSDGEVNFVYDAVFTNSSWTGNKAGKIQHHSNWLYLQAGTSGIKLRSSNGSDETLFSGRKIDIEGGRNSSDDALVVHMEDNRYRKIQLAEATVNHAVGTYGGFIGYDAANNYMTLGTNQAGTVHEGMRFHRSGGYVTKPSQPKFSAYMANTYSWNNQIIVWDSELYDVGNHYNTSNGKFTAPVAGYYVFGVKFRANGGFSQFGGMWTKNSSTYKRAFGQNSYAQGDCITAVDVIPMSANDTMGLRFEGSHGGATGGAHENGFWGYLLG